VSEVLLIRHGETEWSRSMRHTGTSDIPLTAEGEAAARVVGERLAGREFALVLTSPLQRARRTAELAGLGERAEVDADLREREYGEYEGVTTREVRRTHPGWDVWYDDVPGGEPLVSVGQRADRVIERALAAGGDTVMFSHGHFLRVVGARWIGMEPEGGGRLVVATAALCVIGFERERRVIKRWNAES